MPAFRDDGTPDAMLQPQPRDFIVVRAENVIGF
jgi:hypothetical protein